MSDERKDENERDDDEAMREAQRYFDSTALNDALPEVMTHEQMRQRNHELWRQRGDADTEQREA